MPRKHLYSPKCSVEARVHLAQLNSTRIQLHRIQQLVWVQPIWWWKSFLRWRGWDFGFYHCNATAICSILPCALKSSGQEPWWEWGEQFDHFGQHCCDGLHQKVKRQKSSNSNWSVAHHGDSCTNQWRKKKEWKKAAAGTMKLDRFPVVSCLTGWKRFQKLTSAFCSKNGHVHHLLTHPWCWEMG